MILWVLTAHTVNSVLVSIVKLPGRDLNTTGTPFKSGTSILDAHFDIQILNNNGNTVIATMRSSLTKSVPVGGTPAKTVSLRAAKQVIDYTAAGTHASKQM